jgi:hypothetical protein
VLYLETVVGRIFKTPDFVTWAKDEGVNDKTLIKAIKAKALLEIKQDV